MPSPIATCRIPSSLSNKHACSNDRPQVRRRTGQSLFAHGRSLRAVFIGATVFGLLLCPTVFVGSIIQPGRIVRSPSVIAARASAGPGLMPSPVKSTPLTQVLPARIDESRFGEKVRWLMDEDAVNVPAWHVLLLGKTFDSPSNTLMSVAVCLVSVVGLGMGAARAKSHQAKENFFAVAHTATDWADSMRLAQTLQSRGLTVRVTPGTTLRKDERSDDAGSSNSKDGVSTGGQSTAPSRV